ncbi:unnamed protein product [Caenorhabditis auriculariae]|uniref:Uncharacterized protein n=1 Tax=Caenorhabditis auriculariae TaxID=2777116 RepID=A0A8S1HZA6_9PELO|nr:unnamed protein product [Caenorhabditis auriculariae]
MILCLCNKKQNFFRRHEKTGVFHNHRLYSSEAQNTKCCLVGHTKCTRSDRKQHGGTGKGGAKQAKRRPSISRRRAADSQANQSSRPEFRRSVLSARIMRSGRAALIHHPHDDDDGPRAIPIRIHGQPFVWSRLGPGRPGLVSKSCPS